MCDIAFEEEEDYDMLLLLFFPDRNKTQEMCDKVFEKDPSNFIYIPE